MDQPGKVTNSARGQLIGKEYSPVPVYIRWNNGVSFDPQLRVGTRLLYDYTVASYWEPPVKIKSAVFGSSTLPTTLELHLQFPGY